MAILAWLRDKKPYFAKHGTPILLSAAIPLAIYFLVMQYYGVRISKATFLLDFCVLGYLAALFSLFQKNKRLAIVPFAIVITILFLAAIQKYVMLKAWIRFSDLTLLDEAWHVLSLTDRLTLLVSLAIAIGITLYNSRLPQFRVLLLLIVPLAFASTLLACAPGFVVRGLRNTTHAVFGNDPLYRSVFFAISDARGSLKPS